MLVLAGAVPRVVETSAESGFRMSPAQLEAAIGPRTVAVIINSPSNPTGATYGAAELRALGEVALRRNILVITDDIYERLTDAPVPHVGALVPGLRPRLVVINSLSKTYAMTGWRLGYTAAPVEVIKAMTVLQSQSTSNPTSIAQAAATAALEGPQGCVDEMAREFRRGATSSCGCCARSRASHHRARRRLLRVPGRERVLRSEDGRGAAGHVGHRRRDVPAPPGRRRLRPRRGFGAPAHIRLSYATSREALADGIGRIADALGRATLK
jgi:aspartate aminotransferase